MRTSGLTTLTLIDGIQYTIPPMEDDMPIHAMPSDREIGVFYSVDTEAGTCTCAHYVKGLSVKNAEDGGSRVCKHVTRAREIEQESEDELAEIDKANLPEDE